VPELGTLGSVRGALSNERPYRDPAKPYVLALTSNPDGTGQVEAIAQFTTNPAGAQILNAVGPIRQIVHPDETAIEARRYLTVLPLENGKLGHPVQLQQPVITSSATR
jgi:hypothetical protein